MIKFIREVFISYEEKGRIHNLLITNENVSDDKYKYNRIKEKVLQIIVVHQFFRSIVKRTRMY